MIKWLILGLVGFAFSSEVSASGQHSHSTPIPQVITEIPVGGLVIDTPGTYVFETNLTWSPIADGQAILITASDVTLDLQNYTLESDITNFNTTGIRATAVVNLTIKNGTVANLALKGIQCEFCSQIVIEQMTVDGLNRQNIVDYTVPVGILVNNSITALIDRCTVKNIDVTTGSLAAIQLTETLSSKVSHCQVMNLVNRDGACTGIGHLLCDQAEVKSCTLTNLQSEFVE